MARNNKGAKTNDTHEVVVEPEREVPAGLAPDKVEAAVATVDPPPGTSTQPKKRTRKPPVKNDATPQKRSSRKSAVEQPPEDAVRVQLAQVGELVQAALVQVEGFQDEITRGHEQFQTARIQVAGLQQEANQFGNQVRGTTQEVNAQAGEALRQIRQGRQEVDLVRYEAIEVRQTLEQARQDAGQIRQLADQFRQDAGQARQDLELVLPAVSQVREQTDQAQRELIEVRQQQRDAGQKVQEYMQEAAETLNQLERSRQRHDEASRQLEEVRLQLAKSRDYMETVLQECQASQALLEEIRRQQEVRKLSLTTPQPAALATQDNQEATKDEPTIRAAVRPESPQGRIVRHLNHVWAVKEEIAGSLSSMVGETVDPELRLALDEQRQLTEQQKQELEQRLRDLGTAPVSSRGVLQRLVGWIWESKKREPDDYDRALQDLVRALSAQQAEVTLAQVLEVLAAAGADVETLELARRQQVEKQSAVERLQRMVAPLSERSVHLTASAMAATQQLLVEADGTEP